MYWLQTYYRNYLYHRAFNLCKNEKRVILYCQYVTNNNISILHLWRFKIKRFCLYCKTHHLNCKKV